MNFVESLQLAWESLKANRMRSILTMLGIIIGVAAVIAVIAIGRGTQAAVLSEIEGFGSNILRVIAMPPAGANPGQRFETFTEEDIRRLPMAVPEIERIFSVDGYRAQARWGSNSLWGDVTGSPAYFFEVFNLAMGEGRPYTEAEDLSGARVLVLGSQAREELFGDQPAVGQVVHLGGYPFEVVGVLAENTGLMAQAMGQGLDNGFLAPFSTVNRITGNRDLALLMVAVREGADMLQVSADVMEVIKAAHPGGSFITFSTQEMAAAIGSITGILTGVVSAIAGISLLVGGVGIMNIMLVSVTERTREIGIRKAIGARRTDILWQFLIEAVVVSLSGGAIGTALAALPTWAVGRWLEIDLLLTWDSIALALGFSVLVGVVFGVYPASKAAGLDPIEALRYE